MSDLHIMLDCETLGVSDRPPILSIGAVAFTRDGVQEHFYSPVKLERDGLAHADPDTLFWWLQQSDEARKSLLLCQGAKRLPFVLDELSQWIAQFSPHFGEKGGVWGNGALSDLLWLQSHHRALQIPCPWGYKHTRCFRTVASLHSERYTAWRQGWEGRHEKGDAHHALHDAMDQAWFLIDLAERGLLPL